MNLTHEEKMNLLLNQIQFSDHLKETYFQAGELKKLIVYQQQKIWHFHIRLQKTLPFEVYRLFLNKLTDAFQEIAKINLTLETINQEYDDTELINYWNYFLSTIPDLMPI